jgi:hypothetical protein
MNAIIVANCNADVNVIQVDELTKQATCNVPTSPSGQLQIKSSTDPLNASLVVHDLPKNLGTCSPDKLPVS